MEIYSVTLAIALGFCIVALVARVVAKFGENQKAFWICRIASVISLAFDAVSFIVHRYMDHAPGSPEPLSGLEFLKHHPAFLLIGLLSFLLLFFSKR